MTTEAELWGWFKGLYTKALELTSIADLKNNKEKYSRIYNIDEKGCRLACSAGEFVLVPLSMPEIYVGVSENRLLVTIVECICTNRIVILLLVIVLGKNIIQN